MENEDPLHVPGHGHQAPLAANLVEPAQQELSKAQNRFDDAEDRLRGVLAPAVEFFAFGRGQRCTMASSGVGFSGAAPRSYCKLRHAAWTRQKLMQPPRGGAGGKHLS